MLYASESIFYEHGPPVEILTDNGTIFIGQQFWQFLHDLSIHVWFWCAYEPAGNSIVERSHRSIKTIVASKRCSITEAIWYNVTLENRVSTSTVLANVIHTYNVWIKGIDPVATPKLQDNQGQFWVGDTVWVRISLSRCMSMSKMGWVTKINSPHSVLVDGTPIT